MKPEAGGSTEDQIAAELDRVLEASYGAGSRRTQVHVEPEVVVALMDVELSRAEETLVESGRSDAVKNLRECYQTAIGPTFKAIVERATGRRVASFMSMMSVEPLYAVELFRLEPERDQPPGGSR